jgi:hypothetical protein
VASGPRDTFSRVPSTAGETFYDLAIRSLEEQEREVNSLRTRTGTLVAAAAVAATLLSSAVFVDTHPEGALEWIATGVGLAALAVVLLASVYLLRSHDLTFTVDAAAVYEDAERAGALDDDVEGLHIGLTYGLSSMQADNSVIVGNLKTAFAIALAALVIEVLGLGLGAALA